mmetsp:Transcript_9859/g.36605  ORF Transcript_9859/g.36605 Transcript_9859/m.36605 type:complete len:279 (+) Transcript_9859:871-1707(+)
MSRVLRIRRLRITRTTRDSCRISRLTLSGKSLLSTTPLTKVRYRGSSESSNSSEMNTLRTYSLIALLRDIMSCCSNGAIPGTYRIDLNSISPSTAKWLYASGSRNSLNVDLKNSSYCSFSTSFGFRTQIGLSLFVTVNSETSSYVVFITGFGSSSSNSVAVASAAILRLLNASISVAVASTSSTCFDTLFLEKISIGKEMNSEYVFTSSVSLVSSANSSAPSFRWRVILVPRFSGAPSSPPLMIWYELWSISDSHVHTESSSLFFVVTVILSATRNAL